VAYKAAIAAVEEWKGVQVRRHSESEAEPERSLLFSERIVLECRCGERLVLLGLEDDWYSEGRTTFECECGSRITLANRIEEGGPYVTNLMHNLRATYYNQ
jgi:hypothetical protein